MIRPHLKKIICVLSCAVLAALFIIALFFSAPKIYAVPDATGKITKNTYSDGAVKESNYIMGTDIAAVRINDLTDLGKITKVNYVADKFIVPGSLTSDMQIIDLTKPFDFAKRGTLVFVIANLDPWSENFDEQAESLAKYKIGDYWRFTIQLPEIFSASNVYQRANLVARNGKIENYDFAEYNTNYDIKTEKFSSQTDSTYINLQFYTRRESLADSFASSQIITVHYQSTGSAYSGISDCPLIGTESEVKGVKQTSRNLLVSVAVLAAVVFAVLAVLAVVERSKDFTFSIVWVFGITVLLLSRFFMGGATGAPLFWTALSLATPFVILGGAQLAVGKSFFKAPTKYLFPALSAVGALLSFTCPFIPFGAAGAMRIACAAVKAVGAAALSTFIGFALFDKKDSRGILQLCCTAIIDVAVISSLFLPNIFPAQFNPNFWLCAATAAVTFFSAITVIMDIKKSNIYLTQNMHREVERQVRDIKAVIAERDKLLTFVSHDMRKPLASSASLIDALIEREKDAEQIKALQIVKQNTARVVNNLSDIASFAKLNFVAEPSQVVDVSELCAELHTFYSSDCTANGVILKIAAGKSAKAFAKKQGLESVISNIIINALEHSNCTEVVLSVKPYRDKIVLAVSDNGKGIAEDLDVFAPYVSENDSDTGGVGLYICKNIVDSMNGELTFETGENGTTFFITLLKA